MSMADNAYEDVERLLAALDRGNQAPQINNAAQEVLRAAAVLTQAWECTKHGFQFMSRTGERCCSISVIGRLLDDKRLLTEVFEVVLDAVMNQGFYQCDVGRISDKLPEAIDFLAHDWQVLWGRERRDILFEIIWAGRVVTPALH